MELILLNRIVMFCVYVLMKITERNIKYHNHTKRGGLTPEHFVEVSVQIQKDVQSCMCVLGASILPLSKIFPLHFRTVSTLLYAWFLFFIKYNSNHNTGIGI